MDQELKETVLQVADYSIEALNKMLRRMHWLFIVGLTGFAAFLVIARLGLEATSPYDEIGSSGLGFACAMMILGVIFTGRSAVRIREIKMRLLGKTEAGKK